MKKILTTFILGLSIAACGTVSEQVAPAVVAVAQPAVPTKFCAELVRDSTKKVVYTRCAPTQQQLDKEMVDYLAGCNSQYEKQDKTKNACTLYPK